MDILRSTRTSIIMTIITITITAMRNTERIRATSTTWEMAEKVGDHSAGRAVNMVIGQTNAG